MEFLFRDGVGFIALTFWSAVMGALALTFFARFRNLNRILKARNGMMVYSEHGFGPIIGGDTKDCVYLDYKTGSRMSEKWKNVKFGKTVVPDKLSEWYDMRSSPPRAGEYALLYAGDSEGSGCVLIGLEIIDTSACRDYLEDFTHWLPAIKPPAHY